MFPTENRNKQGRAEAGKGTAAVYAYDIVRACTSLVHHSHVNSSNMIYAYITQQ